MPLEIIPCMNLASISLQKAYFSSMNPASNSVILWFTY